MCKAKQVIDLMQKEGVSLRRAAKIIGCSSSTIYVSERYKAFKAGVPFVDRRKGSKKYRVPKIDSDRLNFIMSRMTSKEWVETFGFNPIDDDLDVYRAAIDAAMKKENVFPNYKLRIKDDRTIYEASR